VQPSRAQKNIPRKEGNENRKMSCKQVGRGNDGTVQMQGEISSYAGQHGAQDRDIPPTIVRAVEHGSDQEGRQTDDQSGQETSDGLGQEIGAGANKRSRVKRVGRRKRDVEGHDSKARERDHHWHSGGQPRPEKGAEFGQERDYGEYQQSRS
jgi:hypothetical protein